MSAASGSSRPRNRRLAIGLLLVVAAGALWMATRGRDSRPEDQPLRDAITLPSPSPEEKVAYFYSLYASGKQEPIGTQRIPVWSRIGGATLKEMGQPAVDYLLDEKRYPGYGASPGLLANAIDLLPDIPEAGADPKLYPFLLRWLEPGGLPRASDRAIWMDQLLKSAFICFARFPDPAAIPTCVEELKRAERKTDLRRIAIATLLRLGHGQELRTEFERLPPTESEPEPDLKIEVLMLLRGLARPSSPTELREEAARWTGQLQALIADSDRAAYRVWAASTLLRLGFDGMDALLLAEYRRASDEFHPDHALGWTALLLLAEDRSDPEVLRICLASAQPEQESFESASALDILGRCYPEEPEALALMWRNAGSSGWIHYPTLIRLLRIDRPRALAILRSHLEGDDEARQGEAVRLARREQLTELGPIITEIARRATLQRARLYLYGALTAMLDESGYPLLLAALRPEESAEIRSAAATGLLAFGHDEGVDRVGALYESGDPVIRSVLFLRASAAGPAGVPDRLWGPVLEGLRSFANEDARLEALHVCRVAGRLDRVGEALQEAYRLEPSRLVAKRIREVLLELAHR